MSSWPIGPPGCLRSAQSETVSIAVAPFAGFVQAPIVQDIVGAEAVGGQDPVAAYGSAGVYPVGVGMFIG